MTHHEKLKRDMEVLRESIRLEWQDVEARDLAGHERLDLMTHIKWCVNELSLLLQKFEHLEQFGHRDA